MGYVDENLMPGEEVTYRARLHWSIYSGPMTFATLALALLVFALARHAPPVLAGFSALLLVVAVLVLLSRWIQAKASEFAVTNKRVIVKVGLIRRNTLELLLPKVESIGVDQGVMGRILDYGTITVIGTGGTREPFQHIARPLEFRRQVQMHAAG